jgi:hypothetical protein
MMLRANALAISDQIHDIHNIFIFKLMNLNFEKEISAAVHTQVGVQIYLSKSFKIHTI